MNKTKITLLSLIAFGFLTNVNAQENDKDFNKWSIEVAGGTSSLTGDVTNIDFRNGAFDFLGVNIGARYMFNKKFGLKFELASDMVEGLKNNSFEADLLHVNVNSVINLGQVFDFQQFTNRFGLLLNAGVGYSRMSLNENLALDPYVLRNNGDQMLNAKVGFTVQTRLTDKLVLNLDASQRYLALRSLNLDGSRNDDGALKRIDGGVLNFTLGLSYYLGKNEKHSDWTPYTEVVDLSNELEQLQQKLADLESSSVTKKDLDNLRRDMDQKVSEGIAGATRAAAAAGNKGVSGSEIPQYLMNNDFVAAYFDFNKRNPTNVSTSGIDFLVTYLRNNPSAKVTLIGYADEVGKSTYNEKLAKDRAESVKRVITKAGIDASRIDIKSGGEDNSVDPKSAEARTIVRRVVFRVK